MDSYEKLYTQYYPAVYSYLVKLTSDRDLAEELTQQTFFKIFERIDEFRGDSKFSTWACSIARNGYNDYLRKKKREQGLPSDGFPDERGPTMEQQVEARELSKKVHETLHLLPEPYREVFWMRAFGELPFAEIARLHGKTESWARVTYHRARLMIREEIE